MCFIHAYPFRIGNYIGVSMYYRKYMITRAVTSFELSWTSLFRPFSSSLWGALLAAMILLSASLGVMYQAYHHYAASGTSGRSGLVQNICNSSFYVFNSFCGQGTYLSDVLNIKSKSEYVLCIQVSKFSHPSPVSVY
jgi:hypothetical protein